MGGSRMKKYAEVEEAENQIALYKIGKFIKFEKEQKEYDVIDDYIYNRGNNAIRKRKKLSKCKRRS